MKIFFYCTSQNLKVTVKNNNNKKLLFYVLFLQIRVHGSLKCKESKHIQNKLPRARAHAQSFPLPHPATPYPRERWDSKI